MPMRQCLCGGEVLKSDFTALRDSIVPVTSLNELPTSLKEA